MAEGSVGSRELGTIQVRADPRTRNPCLLICWTNGQGRSVCGSSELCAVQSLSKCAEDSTCAPEAELAVDLDRIFSVAMMVQMLRQYENRNVAYHRFPYREMLESARING